MQSALLDRDPAASVPIDDPGGASELLSALRSVGDADQLAKLVERLPAAGQFAQFIVVDADHEERFRFGRKLDGSAAAPWSWDDLE